MRVPQTLDRGIRLFRHPILDWGSRVHPALPALFWGPLATTAFVWSILAELTVATALGWATAGFGVWIFFEYAIHRWFFHFRPSRAWMQRLFYLVHEHHHRYQERDRLLAPPLLALPIAATCLGLFYLTVGRWAGLAAVGALFGGFIFAYLVYDYTHFYVHFGRPRTRWGRYVRRCHLQHHFSTPDTWYCISWPWLDYLFRTQGGRRRSEGLEEGDMPYDVFDSWSDEGLPPMVREHERRRAEEEQAATASGTMAREAEPHAAGS
jgi:dihydroceramide fatty acyl 2-hydroxylase